MTSKSAGAASDERLSWCLMRWSWSWGMRMADNESTLVTYLEATR